MSNSWIRVLSALAGMLLSMGVQAAATCTSKATGSWASATTWVCTGTPVVTIPGASDTAIIASPNVVTLAGSIPVMNVTVNTGGTLAAANFILSISGNLSNNGTISGTGSMNVTGAASVISGTGAYSGSRLYTSGTAQSIAAGAVLNFSGASRMYVGRNAAGATVAASILTINGTINSTVPTATTAFLRLYSNSTVIGSSGVINAAVSAITFNTATAKVTNNGSVSVNKITQNKATNGWTQGVNSNLTMTATSTVGVLTASNTGNTVTYTAPATPITPSGNTYFNLAGTGVVCPVTFTVTGSSPCITAPGAGFVISSPTNCVNLTGVGTVAWATPGNATVSDTLYATQNAVKGNITTNYLQCTGFNFAAVPVGATINGITVYVTRKTNGGTIRDAFVYMLKAGTISTTLNGATATNYTTADVAEMHGGMTNLWGNTWTDADVKAANFGAVFAAKNTSTTSATNRTVSVNFIQIRVDYAATSVDHVAVNTSNVGSTCVTSNVTFTPHTTAHTAPTGGGGTIRLSTSDARGDWSVVTGTGTVANGTANDGLATYSYGAGETSAVLGLNHTNAGTITIGVADNATGTSLLSKTPAAELANTIAFSAGGFVVTDAAGVAIASMTQTAGTTSPVYYLKANTASCASAYANTILNVDMAFECIDPATCQSPVVTMTNATTNAATALSTGLPNGSNPATATSYKPVSLNFNASSLAPFKLNYPDVGNITLYFRYTPANLLSESNPFVVKPAGFVLSAIKRSRDNLTNPSATSATGAGFVKSGEAFSATVTAVNAQGGATPNFGREVQPESVKLTSVLVAPAGGNNPLINCADATNATTCNGAASPTVPLFGTFAAGVASGVNFSWDEVGIITLTPEVADGNYLGVGNVFGTPSANVGRFTLAKFLLQNPLLDDRSDLCNNGLLISDGITACPAFTYMGERIDASFILTPASLHNVASHNYVSSFAKLDPASFVNLNMSAVDSVSAATPAYLGARLSVAGLPLVTCTTMPCFQQAGPGTPAQADVNVPFMLSRAAAPDGDYGNVDIGIAPLDSDGAAVDAQGLTGAGSCNNTAVTGCYDLDTDAVAGNDHAQLGTTAFRYGRSRIASAYGSELLPLTLPVYAEYWNGTSFVTSVDDNISALAITLGNYQLNLKAGATTLTAPSLVAGVGQIGLSAPGLGNNGSVDLTLAAQSYLPAVGAARATFGVYGGNPVFIYRGRRGR